MDVVAAAGAIRCRIIAAENSEMIASADCHLRDIRHEVIRNTLRILTNTTGFCAPIGLK